MENSVTKNIIVLGAGPAGLGVAYELSKNGVECNVFDKNKEVGGLARSFNFGGHSFDIGPHRFFTKNEEVNKFWHNILGSDFLKVKRLTRIYYAKKFFNYPIRFGNAFWGLGLLESFLILVSYIFGKIKFLNKKPKNFEEWMVKNFGYRLYSIFFKTYTEKVWGIPCKELGPEWAVQRIKNLSLMTVVKNLFTVKNRSKSLIHEFYYPLKGAGMMYDKMRDHIENYGSGVSLNSEIIKVYHRNNSIFALDIKNDGKLKHEFVNFLFSSAPITFLVKVLEPKPSYEVLDAAHRLYYRDHITVNLVVRGKNIFKDQWIYIHDSRVKMARISNYANFSNVNDDLNTAPLSIEYFTFSKDDLWKMLDDELMNLAQNELRLLNLIEDLKIEDGFVVREKDSYPTYYAGHKEQFNILKNYLSRFSNLQLVGRAGMYKYNNQDHALLTGILAARNFLGENNDIWGINAEDEYLEIKKHE